MGDEKKGPAEMNPLDKLKGFVCRHGKEIAIGAGVTAIGVGTVIFLKKNPEVGERLILSFTGLFDSDEEPEILAITDAVEVEDDLLEELPEIDLSKTYSATRLGSMVGKSNREMNAILKEKGFMEGDPGYYRPTQKGEAFCVEKAEDNGYGGYAARSWSWLEWSKDILPFLEVGDPEEHRRQVNENRAEAGLDPLPEAA